LPRSILNIPVFPVSYLLLCAQSGKLLEVYNAYCLNLKFISNGNTLSVKMVKSVLIVHGKLLLEISWFSPQPASLAVTCILVSHQRMLWRDEVFNQIHYVCFFAFVMFQNIFLPMVTSIFVVVEGCMRQSLGINQRSCSVLSLSCLVSVFHSDTIILELPLSCRI
jgi:hypothetical protein